MAEGPGPGTPKTLNNKNCRAGTTRPPLAWFQESQVARKKPTRMSPRFYFSAQKWQKFTRFEPFAFPALTRIIPQVHLFKKCPSFYRRSFCPQLLKTDKQRQPQVSSKDFSFLCVASPMLKHAKSNNICLEISLGLSLDFYLGMQEP